MHAASEGIHGARSSGGSLGLVLAAFFALRGCWPLVHGGPPHAWLAGLAAALLGVAMVFSLLITPPGLVHRLAQAPAKHVPNPLRFP